MARWVPLRHNEGMRHAPDPYYRHRFPAEIIRSAVWLYHTFSLSFRDVELLLAERGITVSYETVRRWCRKFAQTFANWLRRRRSKPGDRWHLDEVFIKINGVQHYLWRAVDQSGVVLDVLIQSRRNAQAAQRFFRKLLKGERFAPRVIVTDQLKSYGAAKRFKSPRQAQQFLSAHGLIRQIFHPGRHHLSAAEYRTYRAEAFEAWAEITSARTAA